MLAFIRNWIYKLPVNKALQEVVLEALRFAVFGFISTFLTVVIARFQTIPNQELVILVLTSLLRAIDKYKYIANQDNKAVKTNVGLVGF